MNIWERLGKILEANFKASLGRGVGESVPRSDFSDFRRNENRNQRTETASNIKEPKLARAYAALEIPYGSDLPTAKSAWKKLLKKYHPDLYSNDVEKAKIAHEVTQGLNDAFQTIQQSLNKTHSS